MRDHVLALRAEVSGLPPEVAAAHRAQLSATVGAAAIEWCTRTVSADQMECTLAARTAAALDECFAPASAPRSAASTPALPPAPSPAAPSDPLRAALSTSPSAQP